MVAAAEMPLRDQPIAAEIGCRNTASDNIVPKPTQVISAPAPTTTQPYENEDWSELGWENPDCLLMRFLNVFLAFMV